MSQEDILIFLKRTPKQFYNIRTISNQTGINRFNTLKGLNKLIEQREVRFKMESIEHRKVNRKLYSITQDKELIEEILNDFRDIKFNLGSQFNTDQLLNILILKELKKRQVKSHGSE